MPAEVITADVIGACTTPISDDHDDKFGVPSLEELGRCHPLHPPIYELLLAVFYHALVLSSFIQKV